MSTSGDTSLIIKTNNIPFKEHYFENSKDSNSKLDSKDLKTTYQVPTQKNNNIEIGMTEPVFSPFSKLRMQNFTNWEKAKLSIYNSLSKCNCPINPTVSKCYSYLGYAISEWFLPNGVKKLFSIPEPTFYTNISHIPVLKRLGIVLDKWIDKTGIDSKDVTLLIVCTNGTPRLGQQVAQQLINGDDNQELYENKPRFPIAVSYHLKGLCYGGASGIMNAYQHLLKNPNELVVVLSFEMMSNGTNTIITDYRGNSFQAQIEGVQGNNILAKTVFSKRFSFGQGLYVPKIDKNQNIDSISPPGLEMDHALKKELNSKQNLTVVDLRTRSDTESIEQSFKHQHNKSLINDNNIVSFPDKSGTRQIKSHDFDSIKLIPKVPKLTPSFENNGILTPASSAATGDGCFVQGFIGMELMLKYDNAICAFVDGAVTAVGTDRENKRSTLHAQTEALSKLRQQEHINKLNLNRQLYFFHAPFALMNDFFRNFLSSIGVTQSEVLLNPMGSICTGVHVGSPTVAIWIMAGLMVFKNQNRPLTTVIFGENQSSVEQHVRNAIQENMLERKKGTKKVTLLDSEWLNKQLIKKKIPKVEGIFISMAGIGGNAVIFHIKPKQVERLQTNLKVNHLEKMKNSLKDDSLQVSSKETKSNILDDKSVSKQENKIKNETLTE